MERITNLSILNDERQNQLLLTKLPDWLVNRWTRKVRSYTRDKDIYPPFMEFVEFIKEEAEVMNDPVASIHALRAKSQVKTQTRQSIILQSSSSENRGSTKKEQDKSKINTACPLCSESHDLDECSSFKSKSLKERKDFVRMNNLCFACFVPNHKSVNCRRRKTCEVCSRRHPTTLHEYNASTVQATSNTQEENAEPAKQSVSLATTLSTIQEEDSFHPVTSIVRQFVPVWLSTTDAPDNEILVYAILDNQSDTTFISSNAVRDLKLQGVQTHLRMSTMTSSDMLVPTTWESISGRLVEWRNIYFP